MEEHKENIEVSDTEPGLDNFGPDTVPEKNKNSGPKLIIVALVVLVIIVILGFRNWGGPRDILTDGISVESDNITSDNIAMDSDLTNYPDYAQLASMQSLELINNFESWTPDSQLVDSMTKTIGLKQTGELAKAYLYVKANVEEKALTKFDSFYFKLDKIGGHLFRPNSLAVPESDSTELLYPLERISYLPSIPYNEDRVPVEVNLLDYFGDGRSMYVFSFISSRRQGQIDDLIIYYDCQEDSECLLETI